MCIFYISRHKAFFSDLEVMSASTSARSSLQLAPLQPSSSSRLAGAERRKDGSLGARWQVTAAAPTCRASQLRRFCLGEAAGRWCVLAAGAGGREMVRGMGGLLCAILLRPEPAAGRWCALAAGDLAFCLANFESKEFFKAFECVSVCL